MCIRRATPDAMFICSVCNNQDVYVFQMIPRAMPDMYMRAYPRLCRAILGVLYMCLFFLAITDVHKALPSSNRLA